MADILIIGGGVAGLAAGITAAENGHAVRIYERSGRIGGNLTGWDRCGCHIDNCIHWLTGTNKLTDGYKMWERLGALGDVPIYVPDTLFTFEADGISVSLHRDIRAFEADMLRAAPKDEGEIRSLIRAVKAMIRLDGISPDDTAKRCTTIKKALSLPSLAKYCNMTTGNLSDRFTSPVLRGFFESLLGRDFAAIALIAVFATFCSGNGDIPEGGSSAMAERMADRFIRLGGRVRLGCGVGEISIADGRAVAVTLDDGSKTTADHVLIACDPAAVFGRMLDAKNMPHALKKQYNDRRMKRFSSVQCAFVCDGKPGFRGDCIFAVPDEYRRTLASKYIILREFSHEPDFAPDGKTVIQSMIFVLEDGAKKWISLSSDKNAYGEKKRKFANAVLETVTSHFPDLHSRLTCIDSWTPATYRRFVSSEIGSYMSFTIPQGRLPKRIKPEIRGIDNVFLATQWLRSPGGLPNAARAGIDAVRAIEKLQKKE